MDEPVAPAAKPPLLERLLRWRAGPCAVCHAWSGRPVCDACVGRYAPPRPRCRRCAAPLPMTGAHTPDCGRCLRQPPALARTVAALDYRFPWDGLLQRFKYHAALELRDGLVEQLDAALDRAGLEAPDRLLPVPLSAQRLRERGYNQSHELARALARRRGLRCDARLLLRVRDNPHQAGLKLQARAANVRGVFAVDPLRAGLLRGARIALVDDVMTSGATLFELAALLHRHGAAEVQAWVVARTPEPGGA